MKLKICILGGLLIVLGSCYKDRGNYDYTRVNEVVSLTFLPVPTRIADNGNGYEYMYRRPSVDTLLVTYTPVVSQDLREGEDNLEFFWKVARTVGKEKTVRDTVYTRELTLAFLPKQETHYTVDLRVTDRETGVEYWRLLKMNTRFPFVNAWFLLTGPEGDRMLSSIEQPDVQDSAIVSLDAYLETTHIRRFQHATDLMYAAWQDYNPNRSASLTVIEADTVHWLYAYGLSENRPFNMVFPPQVTTELADGGAAELGRMAMLRDKGGKLYYTGMHGFYFPARVGDDLSAYQAEKVYVSAIGAMTAWDDVHKQFLYYMLNGNNSNWALKGDETVFPPESVTERDGYMEAIPAGGVGEAWGGAEIWWLGEGLTPASIEEGATAVGRSDGHTYIYLIESGKGGGKGGGGDLPVSIRRVRVSAGDMDAASAFAVSAAYSEQLFYTSGSKVLLYNTVSGESRELYDAGGQVTGLKFRVASTDNGRIMEESRRLAVLVRPAAGQGEFHELFLDEAADVIKVNCFKGFGEIRDAVYAYNVRRDRF